MILHTLIQGLAAILVLLLLIKGVDASGGLGRPEDPGGPVL